MRKETTKEDYIRDLEGCEFHFMDRGIIGCTNGKLIDGGELVFWYDENDKKVVGDLHKLPKRWAEACWMSNANYEWPGGTCSGEPTEEILKEARRLLVSLYA